LQYCNKKKLQLWLIEKGRAVDAPADAGAEQNKKEATTFRVVEFVSKKLARVSVPFL